MLALGLILILLAAGAVVAALFGASAETSTFDLGFFSLEMDTLGVFFFGAVTVLLLAVGLWLVRSGVRRANKRRHEKKELNRLAQKLEQRESTAPTGTGTGTAPDQQAPPTGGTAQAPGGTTGTSSGTSAGSTTGPDSPRT